MCRIGARITGSYPFLDRQRGSSWRRQLAAAGVHKDSAIALQSSRHAVQQSLSGAPFTSVRPACQRTTSASSTICTNYNSLGLDRVKAPRPNASISRCTLNCIRMLVIPHPHLESISLNARQAVLSPVRLQLLIGINLPNAKPNRTHAATGPGAAP